LLVDDHQLLRAGIRAILQGLPGIEVVGEARDGREALDLLKTQHPNVVLMDIAMPGMNGLEALPRFTREFPDARVIILSMHGTPEYVCRALRGGAAGYLLKDALVAEVELAIRAAARGETYLTPAVSKHVIDSYMQRLDADSNPLDLLTPRQREILQLVAEGKSTKEIARLLHISVKTVETHRMQLMDRLNIHDVPGLVRFAIDQGLIQQDR
jgi:DNA-binding NarL/FixJ family response regulator